MLALACVCYALRFLYYALLADPWWVMPAEVLHGVTFAAMWAARYALRPAHARLGALLPLRLRREACALLKRTHARTRACKVASVLKTQLSTYR